MSATVGGYPARRPVSTGPMTARFPSRPTPADVPPDAIAAAEKRGRDEERAAVVAMMHRAGWGGHGIVWAIQRGEHRPEPTP